MFTVAEVRDFLYDALPVISVFLKEKLRKIRNQYQMSLFSMLTVQGEQFLL